LLEGGDIIVGDVEAVKNESVNYLFIVRYQSKNTLFLIVIIK
jgi:hypothetical protein